MAPSSGPRARLMAPLRSAVGSIYDEAAAPAVLITGCAVSPAVRCSTPFLHRLEPAAAEALRPSLAMQAAIGSLAGEQFTFAAERGFNLFHLVLPTPGVPPVAMGIGTSTRMRM